VDITQAGGNPLPVIDTGSIYKAETINGKRIENNEEGFLSPPTTIQTTSTSI
jgi:hypothetical protein